MSSYFVNGTCISGTCVIIEQLGKPTFQKLTLAVCMAGIVLLVLSIIMKIVNERKIKNE